MADAELIAQAYGLGSVVGWKPAARGWAGEIFQLVTDSGTYAAKEFLTQQPDAARIGRQVAFADKCRAAGVPNPETEPTSRGDLLFDHPGTGRPWLVQRWAYGIVPGRKDLPTACWLASQAAVIHRLAVPSDPDEPVTPFYTEARNGWDDIAATASNAAIAWAARLEARIGEFEELAALVNATPVGEVVTCHRDLKATNTLVDGNGGRQLLDWDTAGPQAPWRELGMLLLHHVGDDDALGAVAQAYQSGGGEPWRGGVELFASGLAVWLNFLYGQIRGALDPEMDERFRLSAQDSAERLVDGIASIDALSAAAKLVARA